MIRYSFSLRLSRQLVISWKQSYALFFILPKDDRLVYKNTVHLFYQMHRIIIIYYEKLFNQIYRTLDKVVQRLPFQKTVLKQGKINKLADFLIVF